MATLAAMITEVYSLTKRPDLVSETTLAVKAATLKAHQSDYYPRDLFETGIQFDTSAYLQSLPYKQIIPAWRALKYLRKYDPTGTSDYGTAGAGAAGAFFNIITPEQGLDSYSLERSDIVYLAGTVFNIKSSTLLQYALLGCYLNPVITEAGYDSWIADDHPYAIIMEAARVVFRTMGYLEESAGYQQLVQEQYAELKSTNILAQGY